MSYDYYIHSGEANASDQNLQKILKKRFIMMHNFVCNRFKSSNIICKLFTYVFSYNFKLRNGIHVPVTKCYFIFDRRLSKRIKDNYTVKKNE